MARKYKIKRKKQSLLIRFLPEAVQAFLARRIIDGVGLGLLLSGGAILLSILSYDAGDPSWNTAGAVSGGISNWLGRPGAALSDLLLQTLGLGGVLFGLVFLAWGISILKRRPLRPFSFRVVMLVLSGITASIALARLPSGGWLPQAYLGGSAGQIMLQYLVDNIQKTGVGYSHTLGALTSGALALAALPLALALQKGELRWMLSCLWVAALTAVYFLLDKAQAFYGWVRHYGDPSYVPEKMKKRVLPAITVPRLSENEPVLLESSLENALPSPAANNIRVVTPSFSSTEGHAQQTRFQLFDGGEWELPSLDLLQELPEDHDRGQPDENALRMNAELLQNVLGDFNVSGEIVSIHPGPVVTLYELEPSPGTKTSRVIGLSDDIARSMSAISVRAAVVPGRNVIGIELPNLERQTVYLRELLATSAYEKTKANLPLILGKDIGGQPVIADLARMPHLLVAGTTGSGKSVAINTMIMSLIYALPPEKCRFIMIDPKMLELSVYDDIPHLLSPVVTEPGKAVVALKWVVQEMEERYRAMSKLGVRNIDGYNARLAEARKKGEALMRKIQTGFDPETGKPVYEEQPLDLTDLPYIVVIVDEFADLMLVAGKDVENAIQRLAQMARAAGIHIIMATQRPSVDVITGVIKANFPTRISFSVTSKIDSRTILGEGGAEQLLGMGDMLYMAAGGQIQRVHGPFASDEDIENVVNFLKSQAEPAYLEDITDGSGDFEGSDVMAAMFGEDDESSVDALYDQAVALVARERKASTSFVQRHLQIGYNRAARIVEEMERQGVIGPANNVGKREVLVGDVSAA
ncbi:MAG: DNA translocase FtsK 4TM domain-containing protein [Rhodospirillales bacterium]|nr:DNA translocase FtsK 4TM domain-containing protein [Alphaproteobacteria bacterium]USO04559.1 MAG: DNA translocase FtsK 4TM domain-containing protein [Rhodospirillales bacterium]